MNLLIHTATTSPCSCVNKDFAILLIIAESDAMLMLLNQWLIIKVISSKY